jgi:hypothetical protein
MQGNKHTVEQSSCAAIRPRSAAVRALGRHLAIILVVVMTIAGATRRATAQEVEVLLPEKECQVKYALLYSFGLMTTWPAESFGADVKASFVIGVIGTKPFPEYLARIATTKKIQGRQIAIQRYKEPDEIGRCQILYVTSSVTPEVERSIVRKLANEPVLVVSEQASELDENGATIRFVIEQGAVRFLLNAEAAKARRLQFDARLLNLAKRPAGDTPK